MWTAPPQWSGETCFIVAGGPSAASQNLELLRGRKVVAINSSYLVLPWADVLFFGDSRWWREHQRAVESFKGQVVTAAPTAQGANLCKMRKAPPPGLTEDRGSLTMRRTSLTAAINLAMHFGSPEIVLLGADGKAGKGGRTHHHPPHVWPQRVDCWAEQRKDLETIRKPLAKRGITLINCSPGSTLADLWPVMSLEEYLCRSDSSSSETKPHIERNSSATGCVLQAMT